MKTKQTIAVIGATENMGAAFLKGISKGNYRLLLYSTELEEVQPVIHNIISSYPSADVEAISCPKEAAWEADFIIVAVPYADQKEIAERIKEVANRKVVISISNQLNATYNGLVTSPDINAAEELQKLLPNSKVAKAFYTTLAADYTTLVTGGKQVAFIAGNDEEVLHTVSELVTTAGFKPVMAGEL